MELYVVRFVRRDMEPVEEYYYSNINAAEGHLNLFLDDDSELYDRIELLRQDPDVEVMLKEIRCT